MLSNMAGQVGGKCEMLRVNSDLTAVAYGDLWEVADRELRGGLLVLGKDWSDWDAAAPLRVVRRLCEPAGRVPSLTLAATASSLWPLSTAWLQLSLLPLDRAVARDMSRLAAEIADAIICCCGH